MNGLAIRKYLERLLVDKMVNLDVCILTSCQMQHLVNQRKCLYASLGKATVYFVNVSGKNKNKQKHWVLFYCPQSVFEELLYVDSLGRKPSHYGILFDEGIKYFTVALQYDYSSLCAIYAIFFTYYLVHGKSLEEIYQFFSSTDSVANDKQLSQWFSRINRAALKK